MNAKDLIVNVEAHLQDLALATEEAKSSAGVLDYLGFMSKFHSYSFHNTLSIYVHCPDATNVAGFVTWKKLGRYVKKGEKGIPILAPCVRKLKVEVDDKEETVSQIYGFKVVYVFDVSQTEGDPLPEAPITATGSDQGLLSILERITGNYGITLDYVTLTGSHHGTSYGGRIEVDTRLDDAGKAAVMIHELAHELLHRGEDRNTLSRQQKELEAEATAHVVCAQFGIPSASANYLALWDVPKDEIVAVFQRIHEVAAKLIEDVIADVSPTKQATV